LTHWQTLVQLILPISGTTLVGGLVAPFLAACDSGGKSSQQRVFQEDRQTLLKKYSGSYGVVCRTNKENSNLYETNNITFSKETTFLIHVLYSDPGCTNPTERTEVRSIIDFPGGKAPTSRGYADFFNVKIISREVNGVDVPVPAEEQNVFDLLYLDGINLYFGDLTEQSDGTTQAMRPTALVERAYTQQ